MSETKSRNHTLAEFQSNRARTMDPEALRINIDQRQLLVDTADRSGFVKVGDKVDPFYTAGSRWCRAFVAATPQDGSIGSGILPIRGMSGLQYRPALL